MTFYQPIIENTLTTKKALITTVARLPGCQVARWYKNQYPRRFVKTEVVPFDLPLLLILQFIFQGKRGQKRRFLGEMLAYVKVFL